MWSWQYGPQSLPLRLVAADVEEELGQLEVPLLAGHLVELDQGQFDLLVAAARPCRLPGPKVASMWSASLTATSRKRPLAGRAVVGHGRLDQVAGAVQLVHRRQVGPPLARLDQRVVGVQVAVGLLGGGDLGDHVVDGLLQRRVGLVGQRVGGPFEHLVHVGVVEVDPLELALASGRPPWRSC